jgi:hypothetical protein
MHVAYARDPIIFHVLPPFFLSLSPPLSFIFSLYSFCPPSRHKVKIIILDYSVERQQWLADRPAGRSEINGRVCGAVDPAISQRTVRCRELARSQHILGQGCPNNSTNVSTKPYHLQGFAFLDSCNCPFWLLEIHLYQLPCALHKQNFLLLSPNSWAVFLYERYWIYSYFL